MSRLTWTARVCLDIFIFLSICFADYAIHRWFQPFKRGFFCGDESLEYPYRDSTIGSVLLVVIVVSVPSLVIIAVELFRELSAKTKSQSSTTGGCRIGTRLMHCYTHLGYYLFGLALTLVSTEVTKYCIGRLRPHFFAVCQPQMPDGSSCADSWNHGRYIEHYTCASTNSTPKMLEQLGQSFPSAHASFFFYAMLYLSIYLQSALSTRASKLLKHLLQFIFVMFAWYVALTRVSDYWHHWSDVLAGALLGALVAVLVALFVADLFVATGGGSAGKAQQKPSTSSSSSSAKSATPVLPAYTFGTMPYMHHPHHYGQTYQNYGYVP